MAKKKTHMAIIYDFDKTLSTSEMQVAFIESIGMDPKEFWEKTAKLAENKEMDNILAYLYEMIRISKVQQKSINRQVLKDFGSKIEFHKGVLEWFDAIKEVATANNVLVMMRMVYLYGSRTWSISHLKPSSCFVSINKNLTSGMPKVSMNSSLMKKGRYLLRI